jgi:hypothetical protein
MPHPSDALFNPEYTVEIKETCANESCSATEVQLVHATCGSVLETYEYKQRLGAGSYGTVWLYEGKDSGHQIALKQIDPDDDDEHEVVARLEQDTIACGLVGIRTTRCSGEPACKNMYMVMEKMDGSLADLRYREWGQAEVVALVNVLTKQLRCLADKGLLYTDLKLDNVLYRQSTVTQHYTYRLGDLGSISINNAHHTAYPVLLPERHQHSDKQLDEQDDKKFSLYTPYHFFRHEAAAKTCIVYQLARMVVFLCFDASGNEMEPVEYETHFATWRQSDFGLDNIRVVDSDLVVQEGAEGGLSLHYTEDSPYRSDKSLTDDLVSDHESDPNLDPNLVRYKVYPIAEVKKMRRWQAHFARELQQRFPNQKYHEWLLPTKTTSDAFFRKPWSWLDAAKWYSTHVIAHV